MPLVWLQQVPSLGDAGILRERSCPQDRASILSRGPGESAARVMRHSRAQAQDSGLSSLAR